MPRAPLPERLTAQALAGEPLRSPEAVAERLLAVQGQDPRGARLSVRARTSGLTAADVDRALTEERSLLITCLPTRGRWPARTCASGSRPPGFPPRARRSST